MTKFVRSMLASLGACALLVPLGFEGEARADTVKICTFTADTAGMNYHDGYSRDPMTFKWNNSTGEVLSASWLTSGVTYSLASTSPNSVSPGFDDSSTIVSESSVKLFMAHPSYPTSPITLKGTIATRSTTPHSAVLSLIYYGTGNSWLAGYGTVNCVDQ